MPEQSPRMLWAYPSEGTDPFFDTFQSLILGLDASGFASREDRNLILGGGGTLTWNAGGPGLNWTSDLIFFSPSTGFHVRLAPATIFPSDGEVIRLDLTRHPGSNVYATPETAPIAKNTDNSVVLAVRIGTTLYFRNGAVMTTGSSGGLGAPPLPGGSADTLLDDTVQTTDATVTTISTYTTLANDMAIHVRATVWAIQPSTGDSAKYVIEALFYRNSGGTLSSKDETFTYTFEDQAAWNVSFSLSGSNILVQVTGEAAKTIEWRCVADVSEHG